MTQPELSTLVSAHKNLDSMHASLIAMQDFVEKLSDDIPTQPWTVLASVLGEAVNGVGAYAESMSSQIMERTESVVSDPSDNFMDKLIAHIVDAADEFTDAYSGDDKQICHITVATRH